MLKTSVGIKLHLKYNMNKHNYIYAKHTHTQKFILKYVASCFACFVLFLLFVFALWHGVHEPELFVKEIFELPFHLYSNKYTLYKLV